jgi:hypothetical protein
MHFGFCGEMVYDYEAKQAVSSSQILLFIFYRMESLALKYGYNITF